MNLIRVFLIILTLITTIQGDEMQKIEKVWDDIEAYWKKYDNKLVTGEGDRQKDIDTFEKKYNVKLPKELVYSLKRNYQKSRQGRKSLDYPWFGTNVGINLLTIDEIEEFYNEYKENSALEDLNSSDTSIIYIGKLNKYIEIKKWNKLWMPIACNDDLPIVLFIDLDKKSINYQKIIGYYETYLEGKGDHFRFAYIANNYLEFLNNLKNTFLDYQKQTGNTMEEIGAGKGFEFFYYEQMFDLPKGFWTDEYRANMIKKMGH